MKDLELKARLKSVLKCLAVSRQTGFCRGCGAPIQWLLSANHRRWVLFDGDAPVARDKVTDGVAYTYLDRRALHWSHCAPLPPPASHPGSPQVGPNLRRASGTS